MRITHARHPAADQAAEVRAEGALDLVHARLEGLVAGLSHSVVIILQQEGGRGREGERERGREGEREGGRGLVSRASCNFRGKSTLAEITAGL